MASEKSPAQVVTELKELLVAYAQQETVEPLKKLGRYIGFGVGGALMLGLGFVLLLMGLLRGLQRIELFNDSEGAVDLVTEGFTPTAWSWAPYVITALVAVVIVALAASGISDKKKAGGRPK
ncbi:MAG: hypothetical protein JJLCMIEE_00321 [Acidimicrobiales bacterium]|nr:hypothetical protein [Acidimicrobiales bacterium]